MYDLKKVRVARRRGARRRGARIDIILSDGHKKFFFKATRDKKLVLLLKKEYELLKELDFVFIQKPVRWLVFDKKTGFLCDYLEGNANFLSLTFSEFRYYVSCLVKTLLFLKKRGLAHFDVKPRNVYFNRKTKEFKLLDFESFVAAKRIRGTKKYQKFSLKFAAPELYEKDSDKLSISYDFFSLGVLVYYYFFHKRPLKFRRKTPTKYVFDFRKPKNKFFDDYWRKTILGLCSRSPKRRIRAFYTLANDLSK